MKTAAASVQPARSEVHVDMNENCSCYIDGLSCISERELLQRKEFAFLDSLEGLDNYLKKPEWSLPKIMSEIQEDQGAQYKDEAYIFNNISPDEFMEYIKKRYKGKYKFYVYTEVRVTEVDSKA